MPAQGPDDSADWLPPTQAVFPATRPTSWRKVAVLTALSALLLAVVGGAGWYVLRTTPPTTALSPTATATHTTSSSIIVVTGSSGGVTITPATARPTFPVPTPVPTQTPAPTPTLTALEQVCGAGFIYSADEIQQVGNLYITTLSANALGYPSIQLPDNQPLKPIPAPTVAKDSGTVNPGLFFFGICNASNTQSVTIQQINVKIASFTPIRG